jgi:hypothetical protein
MGSSNINRPCFIKRRNSRVKQNQCTGSQGGDTYNRYNVSLPVYLILSVVITMSVQVFHLTVAQRIIVKFASVYPEVSGLPAWSDNFKR